MAVLSMLRKFRISLVLVFIGTGCAACVGKLEDPGKAAREPRDPAAAGRGGETDQPTENAGAGAGGEARSNITTGGAGSGGKGNRPRGGNGGVGGVRNGGSGGNAGMGAAGVFSNGGSAADGGDGNNVPPPHVVTDCSKLAAVGQWEQITPPGIDLSNYGVYNVFLDPNNTANVYVGTAKNGVQKSSDCGATWTHLDTGTLGKDLDQGSVIPVLDPVNPNVLYTGSLYGLNGFFKSSNGGKDWKQILPADLQMYVPYGGFVGGIAMDPSSSADAHLHLIVTWHDVCKSPYNQSCYAETKDGGVTWALRNGDASWSGMEGTVMSFIDGDRWLFSSQSNGLWLTKDQGKTWKQVPGVGVSHGAGQLYRAPNGSFFMGAGSGMIFSPDGENWMNVPDSGGLIQGVTGDGTHVWASSAYPYNPGDRPAPEKRYLFAEIAKPMAWTTFDAPPMSSGASGMTYDPDHKLLYSANYWDGVWRVRVE
jgi:hypothetical protein